MAILRQYEKLWPTKMKAGIQQPEAAKLWNAVDKDGSGLLSLAEFRTWAAELQSEATLKKLDADEDAMVEE